MTPMRKEFSKIVMGTVDRKTRPLCQDNEKAKAHEGEKVPQAGTGLDHIQFVNSQINHVAIQEDADPEEADHRYAHLRRDELQIAGKAGIKKLRQRDHEDEINQGNPKKAHRPPAEERQGRTENGDEKGVLDDCINCPQLAHNEHHQAQKDDHGAKPGAPFVDRGELVTVSPNHEEGNDRNQIAVVIFRRFPLAGHGDKAILEDESQRQGQGAKQSKPDHRTLLETGAMKIS